MVFSPIELSNAAKTAQEKEKKKTFYFFSQLKKFKPDRQFASRAVRCKFLFRKLTVITYNQRLPMFSHLNQMHALL